MAKDYSSKEYFAKLDAYWRAANYISVGQLYLKDNPLLGRPLESSDTGARLPDKTSSMHTLTASSTNMT